MRGVGGDCVDDNALQPGGELLEESEGEIVRVRARDEAALEGNLYGESFAGADGDADFAGGGGISEEKHRHSMLSIAQDDLLLEDADDLDPDLICSRGHRSAFPTARLGSLGFLAELSLDPLQKLGVGGRLAQTGEEQLGRRGGVERVQDAAELIDPLELLVGEEQLLVAGARSGDVDGGEYPTVGHRSGPTSCCPGGSGLSVG